MLRHIDSFLLTSTYKNHNLVRYSMRWLFQALLVGILYQQAIIVPRVIASNDGSMQSISQELRTTLEAMNSFQLREYIGTISLSNPSDVGHSRNPVRDTLRQLFADKYPLFVPSLHAYPMLCPWLFHGMRDMLMKHCPREIGIEIDESYSSQKKITLDRGFIARDRLEIVDLTNMYTLHRNCPDNTTHFHSCRGQMNTMKILMSPDRSDMTSWSMRRAVVIDSRNGIGNIYPEPSRPFAPHLVAIKDSFVSSWGYIFDFEKWYIHGGCSDRAWHHPTFDYDLSTHKVVSFNEPVLSMIHPFPSMFYHEFIELHAMFMMALPVLKANPNITILVNKPLAHTKLFPLLEALDVDMSNYNIVSLKDPNTNKKRRPVDNNKLKGAIVFAPYVITPISLWCQYISRGVTHEMRRQYAKHLPYWSTSSGDGIIVYDRYNLRPKRFLAEGYSMYEALKHRYGAMRTVSMYYGNETLEETIKLFRSSNVFVAAHGGGQANMIFMPEGGLVVEVRPENWPVPCYIDIADNLNLKHYLSVVKDIGRVGEMHIDLPSFLPILYSLIDDLKPPNTPAGL